MGNEDRGISEEMRKAADETFYIPMKGFAGIVLPSKLYSDVILDCDCSCMIATAVIEYFWQTNE
jgi:hypothetical protein